ncbi:MAG: extracellular solute-binding protein [Chloroflexi bacterium]|nr:extracellular solute-binding protein [Chloroflexota bacterium]
MSRMTRRELLKWGVYGAGAMILAACAPKQAEPTAPAQPAQPVKPTEPPAEKKQEVIVLRFLTRQGPMGDHHREFAKRYAESTNGRVKVETEEVPWGEVSKTLETQFITGTMVDLTWGDNAWWPRLAIIGAYLVIEPYVEAAGMDLSKWFNLDWFRRWTDGKLSGLGGCAGTDYVMTFYNKTWVKEAWGKEPTDDWRLEDWYEMCKACVDLKGGKGSGYFGDIPGVGGDHTSHANYRRWGAGLIDKEGKKSTFSDPACQDAIKFIKNGIEEGVFPSREDRAEETFKMFMAGKIAAWTTNPGASSGMVKGAQENNIDLGVVIGPKGPGYDKFGTRVFSPYTNTFGAYAKTKYPQEAFDLMRMVSSKEAMVWLCLQTGKQPGADLDAWYDPQVAAKFPWFPRMADVLKESIGNPDAWFPMPWNTRYSEWRDVGNNEIPPLIYGEVPYNQANIDAVTDHCQAILDLPRPPAPKA